MFDHLENEIAFYEQHLANTEINGSQIEQVFVGYVLIRIYAEFETSIRSAIKDRCHIVSDTPLNKFVEWTTDRIVRSVKMSDLNGFLKRFDDEYYSRFQDAENTDHQAQVSWDKIIDNRHAFVHEAPTNMTLTEVQENFSKAKGVIVAFREALGLPD